MLQSLTAGPPNKSWDQTIAHLHGGVLQSRGWALLQQELGRPLYHAAGDGWAWSGQVRTGRGVRYLYLPYGPVARSVSGMKAALADAVNTGRSLGVDFVRVEPVGPITPTDLRAAGAKAMAEVQPQRTLVLDLTPSEAELRSGISQSNRNLINTAERRGIRCAAIPQPSARDIDRFLAMLKDTVARDGFRPYDDDYYRKTIEVLGAEHMAHLYFAYAGDELVAGALAFDFAGTRYYAHAAAFQDLNRQHKAALPLLWQMIIDAKDHGAHAFDFWGIASTDDPAHPRAGLTRFKRSFGGALRETCGTWDVPTKPGKYRLYRLAKTILKS
jgi:hypothetical protein